MYPEYLKYHDDSNEYDFARFLRPAAKNKKKQLGPAASQLEMGHEIYVAQVDCVGSRFCIMCVSIHLYNLYIYMYLREAKVLLYVYYCMCMYTYMYPYIHVYSCVDIYIYIYNYI